jgi:hypothetical protein
MCTGASRAVWGARGAAAEEDAEPVEPLTEAAAPVLLLGVDAGEDRPALTAELGRKAEDAEEPGTVWPSESVTDAVESPNDPLEAAKAAGTICRCSERSITAAEAQQMANLHSNGETNHKSTRT